LPRRQYAPKTATGGGGNIFRISNSGARELSQALDKGKVPWGGSFLRKVCGVGEASRSLQEVIAERGVFGLFEDSK